MNICRTRRSLACLSGIHWVSLHLGSTGCTQQSSDEAALVTPPRVCVIQSLLLYIFLPFDHLHLLNLLFALWFYWSYISDHLRFRDSSAVVVKWYLPFEYHGWINSIRWFRWFYSVFLKAHSIQKYNFHAAAFWRWCFLNKSIWRYNLNNF